MKKRTIFASTLRKTGAAAFLSVFVVTVLGTGIVQAGPAQRGLAAAQLSPAQPLLLVSDKMPIITLKDVTTPAAGSAERKAIMDVLRTTLPGEYQPVKFKVNYLKVGGGYAMADVLPIKANGQPVGCAEGDDVTSEFWLKKVKSHWTIIVSNNCGGDPAFNEAMEKSAPPQLLGKNSWAEIFAESGF